MQTEGYAQFAYSCADFKRTLKFFLYNNEVLQYDQELSPRVSIYIMYLNTHVSRITAEKDSLTNTSNFTHDLITYRTSLPPVADSHIKFFEIYKGLFHEKNDVCIS